MGESKRKRQRAVVATGGDTEQAQGLDTLGGRMQVRWDEGAAATPHGQLMFFAEFLAATGVGASTPHVPMQFVARRVRP